MKKQLIIPRVMHRTFWCKLGIHKWKYTITHVSFFGDLGYKTCRRCNKRKDYDGIV